MKNQLKTNRRKERECEEEDRGGRNIACCWRKEKEEKSCVHCFSALCVCICQVRRMAAMSPPVDRTHKHITSLALLPPPPPALYSSRAVFRSSTTLGDDFFLFFLLFTQTHLFSLCLSAAAVVAEAAAAATTLQKSSAYIKD